MKHACRSIYTIFALFMLGACLSGCSNKRIDYVDDNSVSNPTESEIQTNINEVVGCVDDRWESAYKIELGQAERVRIDANVVTPNVDQMKVLCGEYKYYNASDKEKLLDCLSEPGTKIYYGDDAHLPMWAMQSTMNSLEEQVESMRSCRGLTGDNGVEVDVEDLKDTLAKNQNDYQKLMEQAPLDFVEVDNFNEDKYVIHYLEHEYFVAFEDDENKTTKIKLSAVDLASLVNINTYNIEDNGWDRISLQPILENMEGYEIKNVSQFSQEECMEKAYDFIDSLNLSDFVIGEIYPLGIAKLDPTMWTYNFDTGEIEPLYTVIVSNGYYMSLYRAVDGQIVYGSEKIDICVHDKGVIEFTYYNPMNVNMVKASNVKLLSYKQIQKAVIENVMNYSYLSGELTENYDKFELCYYCCEANDMQNTVSIIPTWRLYHTKTKEFSEQGISFMVFDLVTNAIDGSYINTRSDNFPMIEAQ